MAKADILSILYSKNKSALEFRFDMLTAPPLLSLVSMDDINELYRIATSISLASKIKQKYKMIDDIMTRRGFIKLHAGTNRVVYRHLEITHIVAKIAIDEVGISDNPAEYINQTYLQPYVTKVFEVSQNGVIGIFEKVQAISSREEFVHIAPDIFDFINNKLIGEYVVDDIGTKFFMNWAIRSGFGPVLLDFPYVYKLDGNKMFCNHHTYGKDDFCGGLIDYDEGFNHLICEKCGKHYQAKMLKQESEEIIINKSKGDMMDMKIKVVRGNEVITEVNNTAMEYIAKPKVKAPKGNNFIKAYVKMPVENKEIKNVFDEAMEKSSTPVAEHKKETIKASVIYTAKPNKGKKSKNNFNKEFKKNDRKKDIANKPVEKVEVVEETKIVPEVTEITIEQEKEKVTIKTTNEEEVVVKETEVMSEQIELEVPEQEVESVESLADKLNDHFNSDDLGEEEEDYSNILSKYGIKDEDFEEEEEEEYEDFENHNTVVMNEVESQY